MTKQVKIEGRELLMVQGIRYQWNPIFQSYWSVAGTPRELQAGEFTSSGAADQDSAGRKPNC